MKVTSLAGAGWLAIALALAPAACGMKDPCAPAGDACGGDPTGLWMISNSCQEPAYQSPNPVTYYGQPDTMARQPSPEPTSSDWCSYLIWTDNPQDPTKPVQSFVFPHDTLAINTGKVTYDGTGAYAVLMSTIGSGSIDLSASCLSRFSFVYQCASFGGATPTAGVHSLTDDLTTYSGKMGTAMQNIDCADDGSGGCLCSYDLTSDPTGGGLSGHWSTQGSVITHFGGTNVLPSQADLCVSGDTMTLWGHDSTDIWGQAGLRTVTLMRSQ
jgi:hypothetical protein